MDRRTSILDAAMRLVIHRGLRKTTIEDIAQACGIERASVYYYFKNKEEIFAEVLHREVDRQMAILFAKQDKATGAGNKLRALFRGHLEALASSELARMPDEHRGNVFQVLPEAFEMLRARRDKLAELIKQIVAVGARDGELRASTDPTVVAEGLRAFLMGHTISYLVGEPVADATVSSAFDAMVSGWEVFDV